MLVLRADSEDDPKPNNELTDAWTITEMDLTSDNLCRTRAKFLTLLRSAAWARRDWPAPLIEANVLSAVGNPLWHAEHEVFAELVPFLNASAEDGPKEQRLFL